MAKRRTNNPIGGLFTQIDRRKQAALIATPLDKLNEAIDFESFRPALKKLVPRKNSAKGGRPPFDLVFMFKVLILQSYYGLSDERTQLEILGRTSFQRFLGIESSGRIPDRTTIWSFKERLGDKGASALFAHFHAQLEGAGIIARKGSIIDASFTDAPRQRNSRCENEQLKNGEGAPADWSEAKRRQKDTEARWTKKNNEVHFGYKTHVSVDETSKLIDREATTPANVHDSQVFTELIDERVERVHADSAYQSQAHADWLESKAITNRIHEKGTRVKPLNGNQKRSNKAKSRIRARVEHVFGHMKMVMNGDIIRTIGLTRARRTNTLRNLTYNMSRATHLLGSM